MKKKLTLSVDDILIKKAKKKGLNISALTEDSLATELGFKFNTRTQKWMKKERKEK